MPVSDTRIRWVPVERVITNLERQFAEHPDSAKLAWRLGRVHAVAFSQKRDSIAVTDRTKYGSDGTAKTLEEEVVPTFHRLVRNTSDVGMDATAEQHLLAAIKWYETALSLQPDDAYYTIGYAWCLKQAGRTAEAKNRYRRVIDGEFAKPEPMVRSRAIAGEALLSLIDLLDSKQEGKEIDERYNQLRTVNRTWPTSVSPIAIPLTGRCTLTTIIRDDLEVCFDADGSGRDVSWTWIDPRAGWLVWDPVDQGQIVSGRQLFGDVTFWVFWDNGYEALASLDDDGDHWLRRDEVLGMKIWNDINSDGVSDPNELLSLSDCGIVGLSCDRSQTLCNGRQMWMNEFGVEYSSGERGPSYDVVLMAFDVPRALSRH
jgi:hypothetical protein